LTVALLPSGARKAVAALAGCWNAARSRGDIANLVLAAAERPSCARLGRGKARPYTRQSPGFGAVMEVTIFCEIRIPIPGPLGTTITTERL
jgi:hypothetical protein